MVTVRYVEEAREESLYEVSYFAAASPGLAAKFDQAVQNAEVFAAEFTEMRMPYKYGTRRVIAGKFKFLIVYLTRQDEIVVIAMAPFKRKQGYWHSPPVGLRSCRRALSVGRCRLAADLEISELSDRCLRKPPVTFDRRACPLYTRNRSASDGSPPNCPDGHRKLLHFWPVKMLQAGRSDYAEPGVMAMRAAASLRRYPHRSSPSVPEPAEVAGLSGTLNFVALALAPKVRFPRSMSV